MAAGIRAVIAVADLIDVVVEVRDARLPYATGVADLHPRLRRKPRVIFLNRSDLAEPAATKEWLAMLRNSGTPSFAGVATHAATLRDLRAELLARPRRKKALRAAVVGAPNTGKSSVVNGLSRKKRAVTQNRPGVTRHVGWLGLAPGIELLDTPGVLAPKITSADAAWQLALCGSLPESAFDPEEIVAQFSVWLTKYRPRDAASADLEAFATARGMRRRGGELDRTNAARSLVSSFRAGELLRVTFERPEKR